MDQVLIWAVFWDASGEGEEMDLLLFFGLNKRRRDGRPVILWSSYFFESYTWNTTHIQSFIPKIMGIQTEYP